jgi:hypothetical protein
LIYKLINGNDNMVCPWGSYIFIYEYPILKYHKCA